MSLIKTNTMIMKKITTHIKLSTLALSLMVTFAACSAVNNEVESLSDEDIEVATLILTESTADETSGVMSSMYDAFSSVGNSGISYGDSQNKLKPGDEGHRGGRGQERNYSYSYDPETGTHTLEYNRSATNRWGSKSVSLVNTYVFSSPEDEWIVYPRANRDSIETVSFTGNKSGSSEGIHRQSEFARADTFFISGLHATSSILGIDGTHQSNGNSSGTLRDSVTTASRSYELFIDMDQIEIEKDSVATYGNLEQGVTGTLTYQLYLSKTIGDVTDDNLIEGTIEFEGDGTALLRFKKAAKVVRFSLRDASAENE